MAARGHYHSGAREHLQRLRQALARGGWAVREDEIKGIAKVLFDSANQQPGQPAILKGRNVRKTGALFSIASLPYCKCASLSFAPNKWRNVDMVKDRQLVGTSWNVRHTFKG